MSKVLVLLASYNGSKYIASQLQSIALQFIGSSDLSVDVAILDDCSTDDTFNIAVSSAKTLGLNLFIASAKYDLFPAGSAANNFYRLVADCLCNSSQYDYFALCDQDDIWQPFHLARAVNVLKTTECDCFSSSITAFYPSGLSNVIDKTRRKSRYNHFFEGPGPGCSFVFSQNFYLSLNHYITSNPAFVSTFTFHDWFFYAYAKENGFQWFIDATSSLLYRQHASNVLGASSISLSAIKVRVQMFFGGWYINQVNSFFQLSPRKYSLQEIFFPRNTLQLILRFPLVMSCRSRFFDGLLLYILLVLVSLGRYFKFSL